MAKKRKQEPAVYIRLPNATFEWLEQRASKHNRARLREALEILEAERAREMRRAARGVLHAQGGAV